MSIESQDGEELTWQQRVLLEDGRVQRFISTAQSRGAEDAISGVDRRPFFEDEATMSFEERTLYDDGFVMRQIETAYDAGRISVSQS